jgi:hypothetical protein
MRQDATDEQVACPGGLACPGETARRWARSRAGRWLSFGAWVLAAVAGFAVYLRLAQTRAVNSDGASQALQAWDLLHGNLLLRGWRLTDVAFYTTEIPQYALVEIVRGLRPDVVQIAAAMTYTLVVLLVAALAKGTATGREAVFRVLMAAGIMLAPQLASGTDVLLSSPDHIGTSVPVLVTWLVLDRWGLRRRPRWWVPAVTTVLLTQAMIADQLTLVIAIVPLIGVSVVRLCQRSGYAHNTDQRDTDAHNTDPETGSQENGHRRAGRWFDAALAAGAVVAAGVGFAAPPVIGALGGYSLPSVGTHLSPLGTILGHNLPVTGAGFLLLGGAYFPGLPAGAAQTWFVVLHVACVALAACGAGVTARRFFRGEDRVPQLLLAGIVTGAVAYAVSTYAVVLADTREMAPVLPFAAALAGRQLPRLVSARLRVRRVAVPVLGLLLAGYGAGLGLELTTAPAPPQNAQLTAWLTRHPLGGTGLSAYWEANVVTLTSAGQAPVRPLNVPGWPLAPYGPNTKAAWFDPARSYADFVVLGPTLPGYPGFANRDAAVATFGTPDRVYRLGQYTILWWHKNLLADLPR